MNTFLIGLGHQARSGKDTAAWMLVDALRPRGIDARRYGFADALKAVCRVEHGMGAKDAPLLQRVGIAYRDGHRASCHAGLSCGGGECVFGGATPDIWVTTLLATIAEDAPDIAIIPDTRFPNEAAAIKAAGGLVLKAHRPNRPATGRDDNHPSEVALTDYPFDAILNNGGDLQALCFAVDHLVYTTILPAYERFKESRYAF